MGGQVPLATGRRRANLAYDGKGDPIDRMIAAFGRTASLCLLLAAGCSFYLGEPQVPETRFRAGTQRRQRGAAGRHPRQRILRGGLPAVDQGPGISAEPGRAEQPMVMGYLHGPAAPGENGPGFAHQYPDLLLQRHVGRRDADLGAGRAGGGRPVVRQRHDHRSTPTAKIRGQISCRQIGQ